MQITPTVQLPLANLAPQHDTLANGLQHVQVQSAMPITQNAVAPSPKSERGERAKDRRKEGRGGGGQKQQASHQDRGGNVNMSV